MNVVRMAWENGFLAVPFQFDDLILCLGFWMLVAIAGLHQFTFLRLLKKKFWHLFLPCFMLTLMAVCMILGEGKRGGDALIFVIFWYTSLSCLFGHGLGTLVHLLIGSEKNVSVPTVENQITSDLEPDAVNENNEKKDK